MILSFWILFIFPVKDVGVCLCCFVLSTPPPQPALWVLVIQNCDTWVQIVHKGCVSLVTGEFMFVVMSILYKFFGRSASNRHMSGVLCFTCPEQVKTQIHVCNIFLSFWSNSLIVGFGRVFFKYFLTNLPKEGNNNNLIAITLVCSSIWMNVVHSPPIKRHPAGTWSRVAKPRVLKPFFALFLFLLCLLMVQLFMFRLWAANQEALGSFPVGQLGPQGQ